jgi:hypothetical protein
MNELFKEKQSLLVNLLKIKLYKSSKYNYMDAGQNLLALMMKKKRAEGSLDMPVVKKKKKKLKV